MTTSNQQLLEQESTEIGTQLGYESSPKSSSFESLIWSQKNTLETTLLRIFPERQEESKIQKVRQIMGEDVVDISDEQLEVYITEFQYLIDSWLDMYERQVFNGLTLQQMLREE